MESWDCVDIAESMDDVRGMGRCRLGRTVDELTVVALEVCVDRAGEAIAPCEWITGAETFLSWP